MDYSEMTKRELNTLHFVLKSVVASVNTAIKFCKSNTDSTNETVMRGRTEAFMETVDLLLRMCSKIEDELEERS